MISDEPLNHADADDAGLRIFFFGFLEHHEMPGQIQEFGFVQHAVDQGFQFWLMDVRGECHIILDYIRKDALFDFIFMKDGSTIELNVHIFFIANW
jgi:hypothetical protein